MQRRRGYSRLMRFLMICLILTLSLGVLPAGAEHEAFCLTSEYEAATVLDGEALCPMLLPGLESDTVVVRWISNYNEPVTVHYGPAADGTLAPEHSTVVALPERSGVFSVTIKSNIYTAELTLEPGTEYLYGLSPDDSMPGVLYPIAANDPEFLYVTLTTDSHVSNPAQARLYNEALEPVGSEMVIHTGDLNDNDQADPFMLTNNAPMTRSSILAPVCGNHDYYKPFCEFFRTPGFEEDSLDYWFIRDDVLFLGLNIAQRDTSYHEEFVRRITGEHPDCRWTVAMLHFSLHSNGAHGRDALVLHFQDVLTPLFEECDVDLVIGGHDHEYDRSYLFQNGEPVEGSGGRRILKEPGQTLYISVPTATGTKFHSHHTEPPYPLAAEGLDTESGYVTALFSKSYISLRAYTADGRLVDTAVLGRAGEA